MNREERIKHMYYALDEEKEILREIQQCQRNWDHSHQMHQDIVDYLLWTADNSPSNNTKDILIYTGQKIEKY